MSWFTILFVLLLAWFFRDLFGCLFAVLGLFFFPLILAALITSIIPQIPIWVAYFGILTFMLVSAWPKRLGGKDPQSFN